MFHKSRYGAHGDSLPCDLNGDVPEEGDGWEDMAWPADEARRFSESPNTWKRYVEGAVAATREAAAK
jgi:hypothetical protein